MLDLSLKFVAVLYLSGFIIYVVKHVKDIYNQFIDNKLITLSWMLMFLGSGLWFERSEAVSGIMSLDISGLLQVGSVLVAGILVSFKLLSSPAKINTPLVVKLIIAYGCVGVISVVSSPAISLTLYKSCLVILDGALLIVSIRALHGKDASQYLINLVCVMFTIFLLGTVIGGIFKPDLAVRNIGGALGYNLNGVFPIMNANEVGYIAAICAVFGISRFMTAKNIVDKYYWLTLLAVGLVVLFYSQSRTSIVGLGLALIVYFSSVKEYRKYAALVLVIFFFVSIYYAYNLDLMKGAAEEYMRRGQDDSQIESMSGRVGLWFNGLKMWADSPVIGHGFEAGVKFGGLPWGVPVGIHMHNAHLQVLVNTGLLGYLVWIGFVIVFAIKVFSRLMLSHWGKNDLLSKFHVEVSALLLLTLLRTFTGSVLVFHQASLMLFMAMIVYAYSRKNLGQSNLSTPDKIEDLEKVSDQRILRYKR